MRIAFVTLALALAVLLVIFGAENTQLVNVRFLRLNSGYVSLSLVILVAAIVGAVLVGLLGTWDAVRRGLTARRDAQERARLEGENAELRARIAELEGQHNQSAALPPADEVLRTRAVGEPMPFIDGR